MADAMQQPVWQPAPDDLSLGPSDIHVWRVALVQPPEQLAVLARALSEDERARAARFHFDRDRSAFTVARGALRMLAGRYLSCPPEGLVFGYQTKGKPYLVTPPGDSLRFNLSHSGELALIAFTRGRELGVDIERRRSLQDLHALAELSFSRNEYAALCCLPVPDQAAAFFSCWARKEAFIKATGEGISQLGDFDVSIRPDEPARLLRVEGDSPAQPRWSIHDLPAIAGYAAAVVVETTQVTLACWDWG